MEELENEAAKLAVKESERVLWTFGQIWNFQLFEVDGSSITLGKVLIALLLAIVSYHLSNIISRSISKRAIRRFRMQSSLQYALERFLFYIIYIIFILFTLQLLSIPITIFTVIGGGLAIGIGFGSQNVVNNFISGVIVMVEQPVRVGDWIELEGIFGHVEKIGARSTVMRTMQNKQIIVPNSFFLEKIFTNWTLADDIVSSSVAIGVSYGSDTTLVKNLLLQAAAEHPNVLKEPAPFVFFQDFGDSSLNFSLFFRIKFSGETTANRVASDLRFRIDEIFKQNNVSIPFPHRELILNPKRAINVRIQKEQEGSL
ncbi:MAG: mechanosensitive ion channel [Bdellovibrionales bacterium]|nr:mechanosensitive ion channel [Bdellovibrionales bacterium]